MNITDSVILGSKLYANKLKSLCDPIEKYFGVTSLAYVNISKDLCVTNVHTDLPWMERCMEQEYYKDDPHIVSPNKIDQGFAICSLHSDEKYCNGLLYDANENYGQCHSVTYVEKNADGFSSYVFATDKKNCQMQNRMLNNAEFVKNFVSYLGKEMQPMINNLKEKQLNLYDLKGALASSQIGMVKESIESNDKMAFYRKIGLIKEDVLLSPLSQQEIKCIKLYLEGKTAKATADLLSVSRRTVESYIENIKTKLNCRYKKDLFKKVDELKCIGVLN